MPPQLPILGDTQRNPKKVMIVENESNIYEVDAGVDVVNDVFEHHGEFKISLNEKRGIPGDILPNIPEDSGLRGLGGAGPEELDAAEPDGGDAIVLVALAFGAKVEDDVGPRRGAIVFRRRPVRDGERRAVDGVAEGVVEHLVGTGRGEVVRRQRWGQLEILLRRTAAATESE